MRLSAFRAAVFAATICLVATYAGAVTVGLEPYLGGTRPRWKDVADNVYAASYRGAFSYADAAATLTYQPVGPTFVGSLVADGLKPYFAYQLKFTAAHDAPGMEQLGYLGRWWWEGGPLNVPDWQYELNKANPAISSFLVFDYAVTDADGHLEKDIWLDGSYHVLWRYGITGVPGVRLPTSKDGFSIQTLVDPMVEPGGAYDVDYAARVVSVFGEYEHTGGNVRPLPGDLVMPDGDYVLGFQLTEESFHSYDTLGGSWMLALMSPWDQMVHFRIASEPIPEPTALSLLALGLAALLSRRRRR